MNIEYIPSLTFTGADEQTNIGELSKLEAEIGLLYSVTRAGKDNRYPSRKWIFEAVKKLPRASLHVCGSPAKEEILKDLSLGDGFQRIQINGKVKPEVLQKICELYPHHQIITQHVECNAPLLELDLPNHQLLVDSSGGRGQLPKAWDAPDTSKVVGYAGGLGPDNIIDQFSHIQKIASVPFWLDMETSLRIDDWFSIERARTCFLEVQKYFIGE